MRQTILLSLALVCAPAYTFGQWLHHPTADVPRTADGKPNLTAPPPRLADGTPDFYSTRSFIDEICLENEKSSQRMGAR